MAGVELAGGQHRSDIGLREVGGMRPFRFLAGATEPVSAREFAERVRRAEAVGFDTIVFPDHVVPQLAPVPAMAIVVTLSDRLRVAPFVLNNDLRHPAVLAHDLATLDLLSDGRLDVAIGAGWNKAEYDAMGIAYDAPGTRVERLTEAVSILKGYFGEDPFSFSGAHYTITELDGQPKPVQRPHPPLMIGGGGAGCSSSPPARRRSSAWRRVPGATGAATTRA